MLNNIRLILFDLDGVLIDSKKNMHLSWLAVLRKHKLKIGFSDYFNNIGIPFEKILEKLGINKALHKSIKLTYFKNSSKHFNTIKTYSNVKYIINYYKKKSIKIGIVTSKEKKNTLKLIKKFNFNIKIVSCPAARLRGKPYPDQLLNILKKNNVKPKEAVYIGDMKVDYQAAFRSKISFIFAKYGYGKQYPFYKHTIHNIKGLLKLI